MFIFCLFLDIAEGAETNWDEAINWGIEKLIDGDVRFLLNLLKNRKISIEEPSRRCRIYLNKKKRNKEWPRRSLKNNNKMNKS